MTPQQYIINRKMNILELGETLGNISLACRRLGVSRQHYYDIKKAIDQEGLEGLLEKSRSVPRVGNRVAPEIEKKVLDYALHFPTHGQVRAANELKKKGIQISAVGGIRSIWLRHDLQVKSLRLKRLEAWAAENKNILTEDRRVDGGAGFFGQSPRFKPWRRPRKRDRPTGRWRAPIPASRSPRTPTTWAPSAALNLGAVSYDAVKHLVLCRIEDKPPRLDLQNYPHLPRARVETTSAESYTALMPGAGS